MSLPVPCIESRPIAFPAIASEAVEAATREQQSEDYYHVSRDVKILIVDDELSSIARVNNQLKEEGFNHLFSATDATAAVSMLRSKQPEVVLLSHELSDHSGLELLQRIQKESDIAPTPVILLTESNDSKEKLAAYQMGASDFLPKPVDPSELMLSLENVLAVQAYRSQLAEYSQRLEEQVQLRTQEVVRSRQEAIHCLARAGEYRDDDTGHHVMRVGRYSALIAEELGFSKSAIDMIEQAAQLHDVGKIGIPDSILHKPGKLDPNEFALIQEHCDIGRRIINPLNHEESSRLRKPTPDGKQSTGSTRSPVLKLAAVIAATHHEKWDGSGYPKGLSGNAIPVEGRIVAVADVFDALSSARPYKKAFPLDKCLSIVRDGRGSHFDPRVLDAFLNRLDEVIQIHNHYQDTGFELCSESPTSVV
ncbi:MAG: response regulator [Rubripirellula sp.]|nr:response regulator [Rubripirellula sp.]